MQQPQSLCFSTAFLLTVSSLYCRRECCLICSLNRTSHHEPIEPILEGVANAFVAHLDC